MIYRIFFCRIDNKRIAFCLDIAHIPWKTREELTENIVKFIHKSKCFLKHMHFSDVRENENHLPINFGYIDWKAVFEKLKEIKYDSAVVLEYSEGYDTLNIFKESLKLIERLSQQ